MPTFTNKYNVSKFVFSGITEDEAFDSSLSVLFYKNRDNQNLINMLNN